MTRVLIAVDDTQESVHAAEVAGQLFGADAEYLAVSVVDIDWSAGDVQWFGTAWGTRYPVPFGYVWPVSRVAGGYESSTADIGSPIEVAQRAAEDTARGAVEKSGLTSAEPVGEIGDPADVILGVADERSVDVIVVGTHHGSWFEHLLKGSVGKDVTKRSQTPVLVVPSRGEDT